MQQFVQERLLLSVVSLVRKLLHLFAVIYFDLGNCHFLDALRQCFFVHHTLTTFQDTSFTSASVKRINPTSNICMALKHEVKN